MLKHTPGPWKAAGHENRYIHAGNDVIVAALQLPFDSGDTAAANANIIAAAPEMLKKLEDTFERLAGLHAGLPNDGSKEIVELMMKSILITTKSAKGEL